MYPGIVIEEPLNIGTGFSCEILCTQ